MPRVGLSGQHREAADGAASLDIEASTIRELLAILVQRYPRMQRHLDEGLAVSINGEIYRDNRDMVIPETAEVFLLPRIQGG
ncbi:MAG: MoaD/ThiS family protein [Pseudomonadales bacterium]|nr:MoaD/ThiS family protein [Pseudomonadales bacterium]MDP6470427.1 MoaD/ThiS family protein [Pseudomonadales bacterium]MDP6827727.1 MoaD/ThiS family protein [Pseudomonadales bacterium]MDP6973371.1 MoaD/ThiS family protein [Pseudomonadales bacterium]